MRRLIVGLAAAALLASTGAVPVSAAPSKLPAPGLTDPSGKPFTPAPAKPVRQEKIAKKLYNKGEITTRTACGTCRVYNGGEQHTTSLANKNGVISAVKVGGHQSALNGGTDYHTLGEIAVMDVSTGSSRNIVEVGWIVSPPLNGDYKPTLFAYYWINGVGQGYNGGGFVFASGATNVPGVTEYTPGATVEMSAYYFDSNGSNEGWWLAVNDGTVNEWIGYYPVTLWTGASPSVNFNQNNYHQLFGEIASTELEPCSDMGLGYVGSNASAARFGDTRYYTSAGTASTTGVNLSTYRAPATYGEAPYYNTYGEGPAGSQRSFRYGGPGWNAAGTAVGTRAAC